MSLDISLIDKETGKEVMSLNWFRNPFGLERWAEANVGEKTDMLEESRLYYAIISEIQRLGLSKERDKTELIEERKIDKKYISFTKIGRIIEDVGCSFPLGISVFSKINKLGFYGEEAEALLDKTLQILNANPRLTFKDAAEKKE